MVGYTLASTEGEATVETQNYSRQARNESLTSIESIYKCGPNTTISTGSLNCF
jgi:hypothetical protein